MWFLMQKFFEYVMLFSTKIYVIYKHLLGILFPTAKIPFFLKQSYKPLIDLSYGNLISPLLVVSVQGATGHPGSLTATHKNGQHV